MKRCFNCGAQYCAASLVTCPSCNASDGYYLLSQRYQATGSNHVQFRTRGMNRVNVNHAGWRDASESDITELHRRFRKQLLTVSLQRSGS